MIGILLFLFGATAQADAPPVLPDLSRPNAFVAGIDVSSDRFAEQLPHQCGANDACVSVQDEARRKFITAYRTAKPKRRAVMEAALKDNTRADGVTDWGTLESILALTPRLPAYLSDPTVRCDTYVSSDGRHISTTCR